MMYEQNKRNKTKIHIIKLSNLRAGPSLQIKYVALDPCRGPQVHFSFLFPPSRLCQYRKVIAMGQRLGSSSPYLNFSRQKQLNTLVNILRLVCMTILYSAVSYMNPS